jgi:hypothetical protein
VSERGYKKEMKIRDEDKSLNKAVVGKAEQLLHMQKR